MRFKRSTPSKREKFSAAFGRVLPKCTALQQSRCRSGSPDSTLVFGRDRIIGGAVGAPFGSHNQMGGYMARLGLQLQDYRLTTAEILYHLPDHPGLLQSYIWQDYDLAPRFPVLHKFLDFWTREIEGKLHSVKMATNRIITPGEVRFAGAEFRLQ